MAQSRDTPLEGTSGTAATLSGSVAKLPSERAATLPSGSGAKIGAAANDVVVSTAAEPDAPDPARIARYLVLRRLGEGAMGVVYSAYDSDLDRKLAIKVVRGRPGHPSLGSTRVLQEAQAMARISHPNVVHVYEVGRDSAAPLGQVFIAMEFVPGVSLTRWQEQHGKTASFATIMQLYLQAAAGLEAAHSSGLIHRDFKPDNVLVGRDGRVRVVDFGLARALDGRQAPDSGSRIPVRQSGSGARLTQMGEVLGTPGYMAPEQVLGEEADARSDQFSFCAALYEALYKQLPFASDTFEQFANAVVAGKLSPVAGKPADLEIPLVVEEALKRGLSRDPAARFPSMKDLIATLSVGLHPDSDSQGSRGRKRRATLVVLGCIVALVLSRLAKPGRTDSGDLRGVMVVAWMSLLAVLGLRLFLRKLIKRQPAYRSLARFSLILAAYLALGRTLGFFEGVPGAQYHMLEMLGLGAVYAVEIPNAGKSYAWLVLICVVSVFLRIMLPSYRGIHGNLAYLLLIILTVYLRPWASKSTVPASAPPTTP
jgi:serine/threonine-protein kinase